MVDPEVMKRTQDSLVRIQQFDVNSLVRASDLGRLSFDAVVAPANKIVGLLRQVPGDFLAELPPSQLNAIRETADALYNIITAIQRFDPATDQNPAGNRTAYISQVDEQFQGAYERISPIIAYLSTRQRDFAALEREARAATQQANDAAAEIKKQLEADKAEAASVLEAIRKTAAEQGVSQQATYFKHEADQHAVDAEKWRWNTIYTAVALGVLGLLSIYSVHLPFLDFSKPYIAIQVGLSKFLIFGVLAYMLVLSARNFLSHKHNEIVNRHRQNALLTFNALVKAAPGEDKQSVILTYAAACIFAPQETGYTKPGPSDATVPSKIIELIPKASGG